MLNRQIYKVGDTVGPYNISFLEEIEPIKYIQKNGVKRTIRRGRFLCPECKEPFVGRLQDIASGHIKHCSKCGNNELNLQGKRFGHWTVLEKDINRKSKYGIFWKSQCDCGYIDSIVATHLKNGISTRCKYCKRYIDLTNKKFGKLTPICILRYDVQTINIDGEEKIFYKDKSTSSQWVCRCDCGKYVVKNAADLIQGHTLSCGCIRSSKGELWIQDYLDNHNINYIKEYNFNKRTKYLFDFYLPDYNMCIEYDGIQHYKETKFFMSLTQQQERDKAKNKICLDFNIRLVRIPYNIEMTENLFSNIIEGLDKEFDIGEY